MGIATMEELDIQPPSPLRGLDPIPRFSVSSLNAAISTLLARGFAPRFLLDATVSRPLIRKGHLWLTLTDGDCSIQAVVWASQLPRIAFRPEEGDGVLVVGKLNFWAARASVSVQVLDLRPSLSAVMRQFERVRDRLAPEGLFDPDRKRALPDWPARVALCTSCPSSALADMLRTARERWPATSLLVVPIPVQGAVEERICRSLEAVIAQSDRFGLEALVLARGGGSREDLTVFDGEALARTLANCPIPVVTGLGHEDDTTIADLVADYRAATPTAAIVALLPDRGAVLASLEQRRRHLGEIVRLRLQACTDRLLRQRERLAGLHPRDLLGQRRSWLEQQRRLLRALSPLQPLERGYALVRDAGGRLIRRCASLRAGDPIAVQFVDGLVEAEARRIRTGTVEEASRSGS